MVVACIVIPAASAQDPKGPSESDAKKAELALAINADDPDANLVMGKYLAFTKTDWDKALPHFSKSSDATLKAAAQKDLAGVKTTSERVSLGDEWLSAVKKHPKDKRSIEERAAFWFSKAWPDLEGAQKQKMRDRARVLSVPQGAGPKRSGLPTGWESVTETLSQPPERNKAVLDNSFAHSGAYSVRIPGVDEKSMKVVSLNCAPVPVSGKELVISAWVLADGTESPSDQMMARFFDTTGVGVFSAGPYVQTDFPFWTRLEAKLTIPPNAARVVFTLNVSSKKGSVWVDDVSLKADGKELLKNGGFEEK